MLPITRFLEVCGLVPVRRGGGVARETEYKFTRSIGLLFGLIGTQAIAYWRPQTKVKEGAAEGDTWAGLEGV